MPRTQVSGLVTVKRVARILAINAALALVVPVILFCLSPSIKPYRLLETFLISVVFSNCIGLLFSSFMPRVWMWTSRYALVSAWGVRLVACLVLSSVGTLLGTAGILASGLIRGAGFWEFFWQGFRFAFVITVAAAGVLMLYDSMKAKLDATNLQLKQKELERERALKTAAEATVASLESRIHPHFLFNTINSVSSLIPEDPQKAERLLGQMSQLLRFSLDSAHTGLVPLEREMKIVEDYLEIEKARLGDRLQYELKWCNEPAEFQVPPLSIQTLVENSIKHAIAPRREGGRITVETMIVPGYSLWVSVTDDGPGFEASAMLEGHGLELLERRLRAARATGEANLLIKGQPGNCRVGFGVPRQWT